MRCLLCGAESRVIDSRHVLDGDVQWRRLAHQAGTKIRRRRECVACGHRFTTEEVYVAR